MSVLTPSLAQRLEFAPPQAPGFAPSAVLALLVHLMLVAALTWGVQWKHQINTPAIEAELWSAVPELAAPAAIEPPPPEPQSAPATPAPTPPVATPAPEVRDAQIALERERAKAVERERRALELAEKQNKEQLQKLKQEKQEKQVKRDKQEADKKLAEKEKMKKRETEQRLAAEREALAAKVERAEKTEKADKAKAAAVKAESEARYKKQMDRMLGLAGASGDANATGTALRSSGPSASYGAKIAARIKPNIVFPDDISGNPTAEVEVRTAPDGSVVGTPRLVKSSGVKAWDDAVIKAILKTETLPKDVDGRIPTVILMGFRPKDLAQQ